MQHAHEWLTPEEVAELLQRHATQIAEQMATGQLPSLTLPGNGPVVPRISVPPFTRPSESGD